MPNTSDMPLTVQINNGQINITLNNDLPVGTYNLIGNTTDTSQYKGAVGISTINITQTQPQISTVEDLPTQTIFVAEMLNTTDAVIYTPYGNVVYEGVVTAEQELQANDLIYFINLAQNGFTDLVVNHRVSEILPIDQNISMDPDPLEAIYELWIIKTRIDAPKHIYYMVADFNIELVGIPREMTQLTYIDWNFVLNVQQP